MCNDVPSFKRVHICVPQGLSSTLFERMQRQHGDAASVMLTVQYRMHSDVMRWSSEEFYRGKLTAHESVAAHTLNTMSVRVLLAMLAGAGSRAPSAGRPGVSQPEKPDCAKLQCC